jgi:hypothetical protein
MEKENPQGRSEFEDWTIKAFKSLQERQLRHTNRQLALEAMVEAMLCRIQPEALPGLLEEYEAACDRIAAVISPSDQHADLWKQWSDSIEGRMRSLQMIPKTGMPPSPG